VLSKLITSVYVSAEGDKQSARTKPGGMVMTANPLAPLALAQTEAEPHDMLQAFYVEKEQDSDADGVAGLPEDDLNQLVSKYFADQMHLTTFTRRSTAPASCPPC